MNRIIKAKLRNWKTAGIPLDNYDTFLKMLENCEYKCEICGTRIDEYRACVDHLHKRNKLRGLLCNTCNASLYWYEKAGRGLLSSSNSTEANAYLAKYGSEFD